MGKQHTVDAVREAYKELTSKEDDTGDIESAGTSPVIEAADDAAQDSEQISVSDQATEEGGETPEPEHFDAPALWSADAKAHWATIPKAAQKALLAREKEQASAYTRKSQEAAELQKKHSEYEELLKPYAEKMTQRGASPQTVVREMLQLADALENPATAPGALQYLASKYGAIQRQQQQQSPVMADPVVRQLHQNVQQLTQWQQEQLQRDQQRRAIDLELDVTDFAGEKNEKGELVRPHFNDVAEIIAQILPGLQAQNQDADHITLLQHAYDQAMKPYQLALETEKQKQLLRAKDARTSAQVLPGNRSNTNVAPPKAKNTLDAVRQAAEQLGYRG